MTHECPGITQEHACFNRCDMAAWATCRRGDRMIYALFKSGQADPTTMRHLALDFVERIRHKITNARSLNALEVAHRYANGQATEEELSTAEKEAYLVVQSASPLQGKGLFAAVWFAVIGDAVGTSSRTSRGTWETYAQTADMIRARVPAFPMTTKD